MPARKHGATNDPDTLSLEIDVITVGGEVIPVSADGIGSGQRLHEGVSAIFGVIGVELEHGVRVSLLQGTHEVSEHILPITGRQGIRHFGILLGVAVLE